MPHRAALALATLLTLAASLLTGCVPASPDEGAWTDQARRTVESVASEVASTGLLLREEQDDDLLGRAAVVMTVASEEAAGSAVESFSAAQPPAGLHERYDDVVAVLDEATDLLTKVRIAVVDAGSRCCPDLPDELGRMDARLRDLAGDLGGAG